MAEGLLSAMVVGCLFDNVEVYQRAVGLAEKVAVNGVRVNNRERENCRGGCSLWKFTLTPFSTDRIAPDRACLRRAERLASPSVPDVRLCRQGHAASAQQGRAATPVLGRLSLFESDADPAQCDQPWQDSLATVTGLPWRQGPTHPHGSCVRSSTAVAVTRPWTN